MSSKLLAKLTQNLANLVTQRGLKYNKPMPKLGAEIITCKRRKFNFCDGQQYGAMDEIELASKGWNHYKANGDFFIINGSMEKMDLPCVPLEECGLSPESINSLHTLDIYKATKFQAEAMAIIKSGRHTLMAAETGCGKTLTYLLPIIENLKVCGGNPENLNSPRALILTPSRELAVQIGNIAANLVKDTNLRVKVIVGGNTKRMMINPDFDQIDMIIATPGAIGKLSTVGIYRLGGVEYTVFDEADTLLDDSFVDRVEQLVKRVSQSQFVFATATLPRQLPDVLEPIMDGLAVVKSARLHRPLMNITQRFLRLSQSAKPSQLLLLSKRAHDPLIIFTNRNETCNWLARFLRENGLKCANINGDMNNHIRVEQWNEFLKGYVNILSSTDVGSRGLDTRMVRHVLNYDFPLYAADYIHRIGRIGRLSSTGPCRVTNYVSTEQEVKLVQNIEYAVRTNKELKYVDGNITRLIQSNIMRKQRGVCE